MMGVMEYRAGTAPKMLQSQWGVRSELMEEDGQREERGEDVAEKNLRSVRSKAARRQCKKWAEHRRKEENTICIFRFLPA